MAFDKTQIKKTKSSVTVIHVAGMEKEQTDISNGSSADSETKFPLDSKTSLKQKDSALTVFLKLLITSICGIIFGFAMEKARVFEPIAIRQQMVFEMFIMLKTFLAAVAAGQLCFVILSIIPPVKEKFVHALEEYTSCFSQKTLFTSALGAFILGIGMALCGACPAMVLIQIGTWVPNAIFTLIGCLLGALIYGMIAPFVERLTRPKNPVEKHSVPATFKIPFFALALPMSILLGIVVFIIEWFWPWTKDTDLIHRSNPASANVFTAVSWPPYASGIILGIIQLPLVLFVQDTLGGSSAYVTVMSQWVVTDKLQKIFPYLASKRLGVGNWWQVFLVSGAVIGGLISASASSSLTTAYGAPAHVAFFGGFFLIFGARFASGCTSGHGISGMALLVWMSFVAVPFMFGGGIAISFAMQATGALDTYVTSTGAV
ncbi:unnamed protein product [Mytilus coruscus]|uniref:Uncharacterized protein n=1 Tax=Mytilus coruscus TaxID=42192 RepID=A0A6J8A2H3_MYTCO|nr:unnamed protein product [Mytilus coruscus]